MFNLSKIQKEIVEYIGTPMIVASGPGSGKTRTLTSKFVHLVRDLDYNPRRILAITFTNSAANEMKNRISKELLFNDNQMPWIRTFHSACLMILKSEIDKLPHGSINIADSYDQKKIIKNILEEYNIDIKRYYYLYREMISSAKNQLNPKEIIENYIGIIPKPEFIFNKYNAELLTNKLLDFDDILIYTLQILNENHDIRQKYVDLFQYIMVDEFQDTNHVQNSILMNLYTDNLFVVGDDFQAVFSWRGSDPTLFMNFEKNVLHSKLFRLEQNYRSTKQIVELGNKIIANNKNQIEKHCFSEKDGKDVIINDNFNDNQESKYIVKRCLEYLKENPKAEIGILYRIKSISRIIEEVMSKSKIKYEIIGDVGFFERKEIKDLLAYLQLLNNPSNIVAFERIINIPKRGFGKASLLKVLQAPGKTYIEKLKNTPLTKKNNESLLPFLTIMKSCAKLTLPFDILNLIIENIKYYNYLQEYSESEEELEDRKNNIKELLNFSKSYEILGEFLNNCILNVGNESKNDHIPVKLMTIHASKGREFDKVFVIGLEENTLPYYKSIDDIDELEEERRLFFVACTRAKKELEICHCKNRGGYFKSPSRFLIEIGKKEK